MIPQDFLEQVLDRTDILPLIEPYVKMKKMGQDWVGLCPFHKERTPSFTVTGRKQFYHCFGCGAHGNAFGFLIDYVGLSFPEAVRQLASDAGMPMPDRSEEMLAEANLQRQQNTLIETAATFFRAQLRANPHALAYFKARKLTGESVARFGLGYAPSGSTLTAALPNDGPMLEQIGLAILDKTTGEIMDRFHDRVMFPIRNARGKLIGFAGRQLHDREGAAGKYLNSPETEMFQKRRELYGLGEALASIRQAGYAIVVEGYMDVLMLHQYHIFNVVAGMGTAFTSEQLAQLFKITSTVIFCFDGDKAGLKAGNRALDTLLPALTEGKSAAFMLLPEDEDPDSLMQKEGADAFLQRLEKAPTVLDFLFDQLQKEHGIESAESKAAFVGAARDKLAKVTSPLLRAAAAARLEEITHLDFQSSAAAGPAASAVAARTPSLIHIMLRHAVFDPVAAAKHLYGLVLVEPDPEAEALRAVMSWAALEEPQDTAALLALAEDGPFAGHLGGIAAQRQDYADLDHNAELKRIADQYRAKSVASAKRVEEWEAFQRMLETTNS